MDEPLQTLHNEKFWNWAEALSAMSTLCNKSRSPWISTSFGKSNYQKNNLHLAFCHFLQSLAWNLHETDIFFVIQKKNEEKLGTVYKLDSKTIAVFF